MLEPFAGDIVISNPLRTKAIAQAKIKTDKVDALVLAHLLRADFLPRVWRPDAETRSLRHQTTQRANLTADRTRLKNRIHAGLHQRLIEAPKGDLFSAANLDWLLGLELDDDGRETLHCHLRLLAAATGELEWVDRRLARHAWHSGPVKLTAQVPPETHLSRAVRFPRALPTAQSSPQPEPVVLSCPATAPRFCGVSWS